MRNLITIFLILFVLKSNAQEIIDSPKFKISFNGGYQNSDWYVFSEQGKYLEIGLGYKINDNFWLNADFNYLTAFGPNDPYNYLIGDNPNKAQQFLFSLNIQKYFILNDKLTISGKIGPFFTYINYSSYNFFEYFYYEKINELGGIGAVISPAINYKISDKFSVGLNSIFTFELNYGYSGYYIGPKVEYFF